MKFVFWIFNLLDFYPWKPLTRQTLQLPLHATPNLVLVDSILVMFGVGGKHLRSVHRLFGTSHASSTTVDIFCIDPREEKGLCLSALILYNPLFTLKIKAVEWFRLLRLGENSLNFLGKFVRFFITLRCFYWVVIHVK